MSIAGRWFAIALLLSCCGLMHASSNRGVVETATLDGEAFRTDLSKISTLRLHLRDGDFRIVGSDSDEITIHAGGKNRALGRRMQVQLKRSGDSLDIIFARLENFQSSEIPITDPGETTSHFVKNAVTIRKLPEAEFTGRDRPIFRNLPFYFSFDSAAGSTSTKSRLTGKWIDRGPLDVERVDVGCDVDAGLKQILASVDGPVRRAVRHLLHHHQTATCGAPDLHVV